MGHSKQKNKVIKPANISPVQGRDFTPFLIFIAALVVRLLHVAAFRHTPFFDSPVIDAQMYDTRAVNIISGILPGKIFYQAPFYSYFLAAIYKLFGHNYLVPRLVQAFIGSGSCVFIYLIGKSVFNRKVGIISGIAAALYGPMIYFDGELLRPVMVIFQSVVAIWLLLQWGRSHKNSYVVVAGLVLGLSVITRENIAIFIPVAAWYVFARGGRKVLPVFLLILCAALPVLPVTANNYFQEHDFVPVSPQGGMNFYIGNSAESERLTALQPGIEWDRMAFMPREELGAAAKPSEYSRWFFQKTLADIDAQPGRWMKLMGKKFLLFWTGEELMPNADLEWIRNNSPVVRILVFRLWFLWFPFGVLLPFFVLGLMRMKGKSTDSWLLAGFVFSYMLSVVLFHMRARYRLPVVPAMLPIAAYGALQFIEIVRSPDARKSAGAVAVVLLCVVVFSGKFLDTSFAHGFPTDYFVAKALDQKGDAEGAEMHYRAALEKQPDYAELRHDYGQLLMKTGRMEEGVREMERARDFAPESAFIRKNLGQVYRKEADKLSTMNLLDDDVALEAAAVSKAVAEYEAAEKLDRFDISIKYDLALLYERAGRKRDFENKINEYIKLAEGVKGEEEWVRIAKRMMSGKVGEGENKDSAGARTAAEQSAVHVDAAQYHMRGGNLSGAFEELEAAIEADPENGDAHALLGNYYKKQGQFEESEKEYLISLRISPENVLSLNNLANLYRDRENFEKAAEYYGRALKIAPDNEVIKKNLAKMSDMKRAD